MKESGKKTIGQEVEAYDDKHKKLRMRNISLGIMAVVVCIGVGLGLRMYGHAVTDGDVDGLVVETLAGEAVSGGDAADVTGAEQTADAETVTDAADATAATGAETLASDANAAAQETALTYELTERVYNDAEVTITVSYDADAKIPDQAELVVKKLTGNAFDQAVSDAEDALDGGQKYIEDSTYAYDISFRYDGEEIEPETSVNVTFAFKNDVYEDGDSLTMVHLGETETEVNEEAVTNGESSIQTSGFTPYVVGATYGVDITDKASNETLKKKSGATWVDVGTDEVLDAGTEVSFRFDFSGLNPTGLATETNSDNRSAYVMLPTALTNYAELTDGKSCTFTDESYGEDKKAGTFTLHKLTDSNGDTFWIGAFEFTEEYLEYVKDDSTGEIGGYAEINFYWDKTQLKDGDNKIDITFDEKGDKIVIVNKETDDSGEQKAEYELTKDYGWSTTYDATAGTVTIKWNLKVVVNQAQSTALVIKDLPGYSDALLNYQKVKIESITGSDNNKPDYTSYISSEKDTTTGDIDITLGDDDGTQAFTYNISYETVYDVKQLQSLMDADNVKAVGNKVKAGTQSDTAEKEFSRNTISKEGTAQNNNTQDADGTIDWTVRVNNGDDYYYLDGETFTDTIPAGTILDTASVKVMKYAAKASESSTPLETWTISDTLSDGTNARMTYENQKLTVSLDEGLYWYKITYTTTQDEDHSITYGGGTDNTVTNNAKIEGNVNDNVSTPVEVIKPATTKAITSWACDDPDKQLYTYSFEVHLYNGAKKNVTHYDYIDNYTTNVAVVTMTDKQYKEISVECYDAAAQEYKTLDESLYEKKSGCDIAKQGHTGVFQITFTNDIDEEIRITYEMNVDASKATGGFNVKNLFDNEPATKYREKEAGKWMIKYAEGTDISATNLNGGTYEKTTGSLSLKDLDRTITWHIAVDPNAVPTADSPLVFTDVIQDGLEFDADSVTVKVSSPSKGTIDGQYVTVTSGEKMADGTPVTISVDLYAAGITETVTRMDITYETEITANWTDTDTKTFTNTVKWDQKESTHTVTVTKDVMGKSGTYANGLLTYTVAINPDGSDLLADSNVLTLEDTISDGGAGTNYELLSVSLYTLDSEWKAGAKQYDLERTPAKLKTPTIGYYYYNDSYDIGKQQIVAYVPDGEACALVYTYQINSDLAEKVTYKNTAKLIGTQTISESKEDKDITDDDIKAGSNTTGKLYVKLVKHDSKHYATTLSGAIFKLMKWSDNGWVNAGTNGSEWTATTGDGGVASFVGQNGLDYNTLYRLEEIQAPDGYSISSDWQYRYFAFLKKDANGMTDDDTTVREAAEAAGLDYDTDVQTKAVTSVKGASIVYDSWLNDRGKTSITVVKNWVDGNGEATTRSEGTVTFDLYRKIIAIPESGSDTVVSTDEIADINTEQAGDSFDPGAYKNEHTNAATTGEFVDSYTIAVSEGKGEWKHTWNSLDKLVDDTDDQMYVYWVVESYCYTGSNDTFMGVTYEKTGNTEITATNQISSSYSLPKTGGAGTPLDQIISWFKSLFSF